jgi:imidazoleglycerol-phosphate dehydratase
MRKHEVYRKTKETEVRVKVNLDGEGKIDISTGIAFFDHLLTSFGTHSLIDLTAEVKGDLEHHSIEDLALGLGEAMDKALGSRECITRFGFAIVPMDESLAFASVDLVKRPYAEINLKLKGKKVEDMATEDIIHFFKTLAISLSSNIHVWTQYGGNDHHKTEASTKALALSIRQAVSIDLRRRGVPSSKGAI